MRSKLNTKQLLEQLEKSVVEVNPKLPSGYCLEFQKKKLSDCFRSTKYIIL